MQRLLFAALAPLAVVAPAAAQVAAAPAPAKAPAQGIETIRKTGDRWCLSFHLFEYNWQVWDDGRTAEAFQLFEELADLA